MGWAMYKRIGISTADENLSAARDLMDLLFGVQDFHWFSEHDNYQMELDYFPEIEAEYDSKIELTPFFWLVNILFGNTTVYLKDVDESSVDDHFSIKVTELNPYGYVRSFSAMICPPGGRKVYQTGYPDSNIAWHEVPQSLIDRILEEAPKRGYTALVSLMLEKMRPDAPEKQALHDRVQALAEERKQERKKEKARIADKKAAQAAALKAEENSIPEGCLKGHRIFINGDLHRYPDLKAFIAFVESKGGIVQNSFSGKTTFVISEDPTEDNSTNLLALETGRPVLSEDDFFRSAARVTSGIYSPEEALNEVLERNYQEALSLMDRKDYAGAYKIFSKMRGYKDVNSILLGSKPLLFEYAVRYYDHFFNEICFPDQIELGMYTQSADGSRLSPIKWDVVEYDYHKKQALLVSHYSLDAQIFDNNSDDWENSQLRKWLNNEFFGKAFQPIEQSWIALAENGDRVFLIDYDKYGEMKVSLRKGPYSNETKYVSMFKRKASCDSLFKLMASNFPWRTGDTENLLPTGNVFCTKKCVNKTARQQHKWWATDALGKARLIDTYTSDPCDPAEIHAVRPAIRIDMEALIRDTDTEGSGYMLSYSPGYAWQYLDEKQAWIEQFSNRLLQQPENRRGFLLDEPERINIVNRRFALLLVNKETKNQLEMAGAKWGYKITDNTDYAVICFDSECWGDLNGLRQQRYSSDSLPYANARDFYQNALEAQRNSARLKIISARRLLDSALWTDEYLQQDKALYDREMAEEAMKKQQEKERAREEARAEKERLKAEAQAEKEKMRAKLKAEKAALREAEKEKEKEEKSALAAEKKAASKARSEEAARKRAEEMKQARLEKIANADQYGPRVPLTAEQFPYEVLYVPGTEPEKIRDRMDRLFEKLDAEYPDHVLDSLSKEHGKWAEAAREIGKALGYADRYGFLTAYGYTANKSAGGRQVSVDPERVIEELRRRYPDGYNGKISDLENENPDLPIKTLNNNASKTWGVGFAQHLSDIGLFTGKLRKTVPAEKNQRG